MFWRRWPVYYCISTKYCLKRRLWSLEVRERHAIGVDTRWMKRHQYCKASVLRSGSCQLKSTDDALMTQRRRQGWHDARSVTGLTGAKVNTIRSRRRRVGADNVRDSSMSSGQLQYCSWWGVRHRPVLTASDFVSDSEIAITATYTERHVTTPLISSSLHQRRNGLSCFESSYTRNPHAIASIKPRDAAQPQSVRGS